MPLAARWLPKVAPVDAPPPGPRHGSAPLSPALPPQADNGLVVHRPYGPGGMAARGGRDGGEPGDPAAVQLLVRKVRNKAAGKIGEVMLRYDRDTGLYSDDYEQLTHQ